MGVTMFWQQKIAPTSADPVQQRVMMFMPVMFTFMFLSAPSGLVIYWTISNLWAIGQQYLTTVALVGAREKPRADTHMANTTEITDFVQSVAQKMGLELKATAEEMPDGLRINLDRRGRVAA